MKDLRQYILEAEGDEGEEKTTQRGWATLFTALIILLPFSA